MKYALSFSYRVRRAKASCSIQPANPELVTSPSNAFHASTNAFTPPANEPKAGRRLFAMKPTIADATGRKASPMTADRSAHWAFST